MDEASATPAPNGISGAHRPVTARTQQAPHSVPRGAARLSGNLAPEPLGRIGRGLVYGTGLFLLRPVATLLGRLVGLRRTVSISVEAGTTFRIQRAVSLLGATLQEEDELLDARHVVSVATCRRTAPEPFAAGGLAAAVGIIWGLWQVADGIYGRSPGLVALGGVAALVGIAVDLLTFHVTQRLAWLSQDGARIFLADGRCVTAWSTGPPEPFVRAVRATRNLTRELASTRQPEEPSRPRERGSA